MAVKKKKKKRPNGSSPKRTLSRERRLQSAKVWLVKYEGSHLVRAYAKRYHTDLLCAITELRLLGIVITDEYADAVKRSVTERIATKRQKKEAKSKEAGGMEWGIDSDDNFAFIAGRTSGGAPYGIQWNELSEEERDIFPPH